MNDHATPKGWCRVELGEIADVQLGKMLDRAKRKEGMSLPYLRNINVRWHRIDLADLLEMPFKDSELERYGLQNGDVLVCEGGEPGRCAVWTHGETKIKYQKALHRVRLPDGIEPHWLVYSLRFDAERGALNRRFTGTTIKHFTRQAIRQYEVPVPPSEEQLRILGVVEEQLSKVEAATAGLQRTQINLKRYRASVLKSAVEGRLVPTEAELAREEGRDYEPAEVLLGRILAERRHHWEEAELGRLKAKGKTPKGETWKGRYKEPAQPDTTGLPELPDGWIWASLEQITSAERVICYGILMPKHHVPDGVLYVKVRDMKGNQLDVAKLPRTSREIAAKYARASLETGDLLLAIRGTYGRVVEVPPELEGGNITQDTARLALSGHLNRGYVRSYLLSPDAQNYFKRVARGVAVKGVNIADVRTTPVSIPPIAEQERVLKEVERHMSLIDDLEIETDRAVKRSGRLRTSILASAFAGKLAAQDLNDEPATKLLERIRSVRADEKTKSKGSRKMK